VVENLLKLGGRSTALSGGQVCLSAHIHGIEAGKIGDEKNLPQLDGGSSLQSIQRGSRVHFVQCQLRLNRRQPERLAFAKNIEGLKKIGGHFAQILAAARPYAEKTGLQIDWNNPSATNSKLAVITQTPKEFDFARIPWPAEFHYAGPFHDDEGREPVPFPWAKLTGRPLIYASLGTLVHGQDHLYKTILAAVGHIPEIQVVLSVGKNVNPDDLGSIPSNTIVVRTAPQIELLKRRSVSRMLD
jgi:UDP:flavonoid glycosyltransferase YjiC (YdhE family)